MNTLDAGILIILLLFLIRGVWVGLVRQVASIAALILGFVAAGRYYQAVGTVLEHYLPSRISFLLTYALLFLLVYLAIIALGFGLKKVMCVSLLGWFDRLMGGLFGLSKAVILSSVLFMALTGFLAASSPLLQRSLAAPYLAHSSRFFMTFIRDQRLQEQFLPRQPAIPSTLLPPVPASKTKGRDPQQKAKQEKLVSHSGP